MHDVEYCEFCEIAYYEAIPTETKVQEEVVTCRNKVDIEGTVLGYDNAYCKYQVKPDVKELSKLGEIHCDLIIDEYGGKADANGDGICQSGEGDCEIIKVEQVNQQVRLTTISKSKNELKADDKWPDNIDVKG